MHSNNVVHFSVHADDVERAKAFYESVFGWKFEPWGPPDFYLIQTGTDSDRGIRGALQRRMEPVSGTGMTGFECSITVADVKATREQIKSHGGEIVADVVEIPAVGRMIQFRDTEGNAVVAMQYHPGVA